MHPSMSVGFMKLKCTEAIGGNFIALRTYSDPDNEMGRRKMEKL